MASEPLHVLFVFSVAFGAVIALICAVRQPLRRLFGARLVYDAWCAVPVVLATAALPVARLPASVHQVVAPFQHLVAAGAAFVPHQSTPWQLWITAVWLIGCMCMLLWFGIAHVRYRRHLGALRWRGGFLYSTSTCHGPAVIGLWRPAVVLPADFAARYTPQEQRLILAHEAVHVRRRDPLANSLCALLQCAFWFHPLVHLAASRFRLDQELACDAAVMHAHHGMKRDYAEAMLKTQMSAQRLLIHCHWQSAHPLKERIMQLQQTPPQKLRKLFGRFSIAALIAACAYGAVAAKAGTEQNAVQGSYLIDMQLNANGATSSPKIRVQEGVPFAVASGGSSGTWRTEGVLNRSSGTSVFLKTVIKHDERVISRPGLVTQLGEPATIAVKGESAADDFRLQVTVTAIP